MLKQLSIEEIIGIIFKKWWIVLLSFIIGGVLAFTYTEVFISPVYVSKGTLYVNNKGIPGMMPNVETNINANDLSVALKLVDTYTVILKSNRFMEIVSEKIDLPYTYNQLRDMVSLKGVNETEVLEVSVAAGNPEHAKIIAQAVLENSKAEIVRVVEAGSVKIVDDASTPISPSSPNKRANTLIGMILGIVISVGLMLIVELLDVSVKNEEDLVINYGIPVVGSIPRLDGINATSANAEGEANSDKNRQTK